MQRLTITLAVSLVLFASALAHADVVWNEGTQGDLSNDGNTPTNLGAFAAGTHQAISTSVNSDIDDFTFSIAAGLTLTQIVPTEPDGLPALRPGAGEHEHQPASLHQRQPTRPRELYGLDAAGGRAGELHDGLRGDAGTRQYDDDGAARLRVHDSPRQAPPAPRVR